MKGRAENLTVLLAILAVVFGGFYFSNERTNKVEDTQSEREFDVNAFLLSQCDREAFRDEIIIGALKDAQERAKASIQNPAEASFQIARLQFSIDRLQSQIQDCKKSIPPVTG